MALPIGGFMPIPLAMMIPFMATQSMVMGDAFGRAFQYGKRKISAMSNEEFNATNLEEQASLMFAAYKNIIPKLETSMDDSRELQNFIVKQLLALPANIFLGEGGLLNPDARNESGQTYAEFAKPPPVPPSVRRSPPPPPKPKPVANPSYNLSITWSAKHGVSGRTITGTLKMTNVHFKTLQARANTYRKKSVTYRGSLKAYYIERIRVFSTKVKQLTGKWV